MSNPTEQPNQFVDTQKISNDHRVMVDALFKPGGDILSQQTAFKMELVHAAIGISGEAGELLDAVKKHVIYGKGLDMENILEELGDLEFFLEAIRQVLGITREPTLLHNLAKLGERYKTKTYSDDQAIARADKPVDPKLAERTHLLQQQIKKNKP